MHLSLESVVLLLLAVNAAVCASVPQSVKDKAPTLWAILDAVAVNVGHAKNDAAKQKPWQFGVATAVLSAVLTIVGAKAVTSPEVKPVAKPWPPIQAEAPVPVADFDALSLADAVSPAQDVSAASPTDY